jgi:hypothetical protein
MPSMSENSDTMPAGEAKWRVDRIERTPRAQSAQSSRLSFHGCEAVLQFANENLEGCAIRIPMCFDYGIHWRQGSEQLGANDFA